MNSATTSFDIYELHFFLNNLSGYNSIEFEEKWKKLIYSIPYFMLNFVLVLNNATCFYLAFVTQDDPKELMYVLTLTITTAVCSINVFIMDVYKKEIQKLHNELAHSLKNPEVEKSQRLRDVKMKLEQNFVLICKAFYPLSAFALILFTTLPVLIPGEKLVPYLFPIKNLSSPYYEGVYTFQILIVILFTTNTISFDMICNGFIIRICTCLELMASRLEGYLEFCPGLNYTNCVQGYYDVESVDLLYKNNTDLAGNSGLVSKRRQGFEIFTKRMSEFLKINIRVHQKILGQLETIDKIYNFTMVLRFLMGTIVFAIAASVSFGDNSNFLKDMRLGGFAAGGFLDLFIYCYCGSQIIESGEKVAFALYSLPWYEMDIKTRRTVLFALTRSRKSKGITAGHIFKLDLELFLQILRFAHSFITLLKRI